MLFSLIGTFVFCLAQVDQQAAYLMQQGNVESSLAQYRKLVEKEHHYDIDLLQQLGFLFLKKGIESDDLNIFASALLAAGISDSKKALPLIAKGLSSSDPRMQQLAVHFIGHMGDDETFLLLQKAMNSPFVAIRMEAAFQMAKRKFPEALGHIESLMHRVPPWLKPYFPTLFAHLGTYEAISCLKQLLQDSNPYVRSETILQIASLHRDDLLPQLRKKLSFASYHEQEAICYALGALQDTSSQAALLKLSRSSVDSVALASSMALWQMKDPSSTMAIESLAKEENLFAISLLASIEGSEPVLKTLISSPHLLVRLNASIALLKKHDPACIAGLKELFCAHESSMRLYMASSPAGTQRTLKLISLKDQANDPEDLSSEIFLAIKQHLLKEIVHLPAEHFFELATEMIATQQNTFIPTLVSLCEMLHTERAHTFLKQYATPQTPPFIRNYAHLALCRSFQEEASKSYLMKWLQETTQHEPIFLRHILSWDQSLQLQEEPLSPDEHSQLLMDTFILLAEQRTPESLAELIRAIEKSLPVNRYVLMGLLIKSSEG